MVGCEGCNGDYCGWRVRGQREQAQLSAGRPVKAAARHSSTWRPLRQTNDNNSSRTLTSGTGRERDETSTSDDSAVRNTTDAVRLNVRRERATTETVSALEIIHVDSASSLNDRCKQRGGGGDRVHGQRQSESAAQQARVLERRLAPEASSDVLIGPLPMQRERYVECDSARYRCGRLLMYDGFSGSGQCG